MSRDECNDWIGKTKEVGPEVATINTLGGTAVRTDIRNNRRVIFEHQELADLLFDRVTANVPEQIHGSTLVGVNERFRCYEYNKGQYFAPHLDGFFERNPSERSYYTFMVYLNDGFEGGETVFLVEPEKVIKPSTGMALFFQHPIIHTGSEVISGTKYVLRTDLMYRSGP